MGLRSLPKSRGSPTQKDGAFCDSGGDISMEAMTEACRDRELLKAFVEERSEPAFTELVQCHVDLVYSAALRHLRGDAHLARDATQAVFCELARNARALQG